ncbi:MAG: hypothetical protein AAF525_07350 [Pseudomonadota bacterium]
MTRLDLVLLARSTPVDSNRFQRGLGREHHAEYLADCVKSALFASKTHRTGTRLYIVMESGGGFPRTLLLDGDVLGNLGGLTESGIVSTLADALRDSGELVQGATILTDSGIGVVGLGFEPMLRKISPSGTEQAPGVPRYLLQPDGMDIRDVETTAGGVFVMSDHVPMPKKIAKSLVRRGYQPLSVGPVMLQTSQCITLIHNEFDRSRLPSGLA